MKYTVFLILLALSFVACNSSKMLKKELVESPTTQLEKDKNLILQHGIDNKIDMKSTPSGMYYIIEKEGTGDAYPNAQSQIKAHYHGTFLNGNIFDSSVERGEPLDFELGRVIKGWQEAIPMLKKGGKGTFFIPSGLAYGSRAVGKGKRAIPANSVLVFDIELVDFQ